MLRCKLRLFVVRIIHLRVQQIFMLQKAKVMSTFCNIKFVAQGGNMQATNNLNLICNIICRAKKLNEKVARITGP